MLSLQNVFTSLLGRILGLLTVLAYIRWMLPELLAGVLAPGMICAGLYLLAAAAGAVASAAVVTGRNLLELLQVKE